MTLLAPLKHLTALKLSKLSIFSGAVSALEQFRAKPPVVDEPVELVPAPPTPSEILQKIGRDLRQTRKQQQLSIEDIATRTRIQPRLIQAIEEGHIEMLPQPIYVKGMIKRYGDSIGLDGMVISQQVPNWKATTDTTFDPTTKLQSTTFIAPTQVKPIYVYLGYTVAIVGVSAVASNLLNTAFKPQSQTSNTPVVKTQPATGIAAPKGFAPQPSQLPDIPVAIVVKSPTWAQIGIDGKTVFTGNLNIGTKFNWTAQKQVTINTNNAGGLVIARGSLPPQPLGQLGQKQSVTVKVGK